MIFKKYKTIIAILIAISTCCAGSSFSNKKPSDQDYFLSLQQVENKLSADGLYELARCHIYGIGTEENQEKALPLLARSAEGGSNNALNMMGILYRDGLGVEKDHKQALNYFYAAAAEGNMLAEYNLGMYFYKGWREGKNTVDQDYEKAAYWLKIAADKGYHYAQTQLGICYYEGKGFASIDYTQAAHLFQLASNQGNILGTYYLAKCYEHGNGVDQSNEKAFDLYCKASNQRRARFPYLIALTNMAPNLIWNLLVFINILVGLRYPWNAKIPERLLFLGTSAHCRLDGTEGIFYCFGRIYVAYVLALFITYCLADFFGFYEEDKIYNFVLSFFYAFCSLKIWRFEIKTKRYNTKIAPNGTSLKEDFGFS